MFKFDNTVDYSLFHISLTYNKLQTLLGLNQWRSILSDHLIIGALPTLQDIREMHRLGLDTVVNLCQEFSGHPEYADLGIRQLRVETRDFTSPSYDSILSALEQLDLKRPKLLYVHCKAGKGRSCAFVVCYLVYFYELDLEQAQEIVSSKRHQVDRVIEQESVKRIYEHVLDSRRQRIAYQ
ncbi:protein-tyrosine phosphatase-like protein [Gorgonomyces haynaldii]|nr:protein-tyrosine phosphatase-like protein [Gorgonomyces haynaldii]